MTLPRRELLLGALAATAGCAAQRQLAELTGLFTDVAPDQPMPPLIFIPGAFGSRLIRRTTSEEIWPGSNMALLFSNYRDIELEIDPQTLQPVTRDFEPAGLFTQVFGRDLYGDMLRTLETVGGYRRHMPDGTDEPPPRAYYVYDYDWRLDTVTGARGLHALMERIAGMHHDNGRHVDIIAHSSGGLIARYYARFGTADVLDGDAAPRASGGVDRIRRLCLIGTPNRGTIQAVLSHVRGEEVGLRRIPAEVVSTCPSVPQLMPHPGERWLVNLRGEPIELDMYDIDTWRRLGWSVFSNDVRNRLIRRRGSEPAAAAYLDTLAAFLARQLERGRRLHEVLSAPMESGEPPSYVFGSDCVPTLARLVVDLDGATYRAYEQPFRIPLPLPDVDYDALMHVPGDGVVTRNSLLDLPTGAAGASPLADAERFLLCEPHQTLTSNFGLQRQLLDVLLQLRAA